MSSTQRYGTGQHPAVGERTNIFAICFFTVKDWLFPQTPSRRAIIRALVIFTAIGAIASIFYLATTKPKYTATLVVGPTQEQFTSSPSNQLDRGAMSLLSGGGLLSGPRTISPYDAFLKTIQTREIAEKLYADPKIRDQLFPGAWDEKTHSWHEPFDLKALAIKPLYALLGRNYPTHPTVSTVEVMLKNYVGLSMIDRGPMYTLSYASPNRDFAMNLLTMIVKAADTSVKEKNRRQVLEHINILKARMQSLDVVDYRSQFANLRMDQEKQLLVLQGDADFAASIVIGPSAPDNPDVPRLSVTVTLFIVIFFMLGVSILALAYRHQIKQWTLQLRS